MPASIAAFAICLHAAVFWASAWSKVRRPREFRLAVEAYGLLPPALAPALSVLVIGGEIVAAGNLTLSAMLALSAAPPEGMLPLLYYLGAATGGLLLLIFTLSIGFNLWRGRNFIDCGCYPGAQRDPIGAFHIVRNCLLLMLLAPVALAPISLSILDLVQGLAGALVSILLYLAAMQLRRNWRALELA
ncbi:MAG: hypothetical protein K1X75_08210 [Leptospirales bacterium]|nr:hypothetical protein [Leptospirales bacterium]